MKKKLVLLVVLLLLLCGLTGFAVHGDAIIDFFSPVRNDWKKDENTGLYYYMDENGDPVTGWFDEREGVRLYLDPARGGARTSGWMEIDGKTYYFHDSGAMAAGWHTLDGTEYYFDENGALYSGWLEEAGKKLYLTENGTRHYGWLTLEEGTYYLDASGVLASGWIETEGQRYYLDESGRTCQGWLELEDGTYYLNGDGSPATGWLEQDDSRYYLDESGRLYRGWLETETGRFFITETGAIATGWIEHEGRRYFLKEDGTPATGWMDQDGKRYYLKEDGSAAVGTLNIDGQNYFFSSTGANFLMVNRWNSVPEGYEVELKKLPNGRKVAAECYDALMQMMKDCEAAGCDPNIIGAHRTNASQKSLFNTRLAENKIKYGSANAYAKTAEAVAIPGTSEHELGLALDILDKKYPRKYSGSDNSLVWMAEHCWEYGFIVRYPEDKTAITAIKFEPWHFRYVGVELAMELKDSGLCLEEYLDKLTNDGTTCGNPDALKNK